ncbi:MAG: histidine phosphatase family protein [Thomasclavelia ramosa]|nr:histidine phosphatase family protein [Thomasclavelia ramosa]
MRHGQTLFNLQHKIQGWCDAPLIELGIKQAKKASEYFVNNNITFDHVYSSTSERACDTLEIVTDYKMPYTRVKGLKEWNFGAFEGKDKCLNPKLPYGDFFKAYGGEGEMELRERMNRTLTDIMQKDDHKVVLAVSHGAACAQFYRAWEQYAKVIKKERFYNCCILKFEYEDGIFTLVELFNRNITE